VTDDAKTPNAVAAGNVSHEALVARAAQLSDQINAYRRAYYEGNTVLVADDVYDSLMQELEAIERANPELITGDSPTQSVGGAANELSHRFNTSNA